MTWVGFASFSGSCIALRSSGNCGTEKGGFFLIWYNLDVVVPWVVLCGLLTPWFMVGNRCVPNCPFISRLHVSTVWSFVNVKLWNVNVGSLRGGGVVRRDSGSFQFP